MGSRAMDTDVAAWIDAGLITAEQGDAIRRFEAPDPPRRGTSLVAEVLGYLGAALVAIAGLLLVVDVWEQLGRLQQVAVTASSAAALLVVGVVAGREAADGPRRRLARTVLLLSLIPLGLTIGLIAETGVDDTVAVPIGFAGASLVATALYRRDRSWAQHLGLFAAVAGTVMTIEPATEFDVYLGFTGPSLFVLGLAWMTAASRGSLPPDLLGETLGAGALGLGSVLLVAAADPATTGGLVALGAMIAVAIGCLVVGVRRDRVVWIATGIVGLLGYVPWLATELFDDTIGAPIGLAVAGAALLGVMGRIRRRDTERSDPS